MLGNIIGGFIIIIVGLSVAPTVADTVYGARYNSYGNTTGVNVTGAASTILGLTTLFYCLAIASVGIGVTTVGLRKAGLV